jgi:hypothetical protein
VSVVNEWERGGLLEVQGLADGDVIVAAPLDDLEAGEAYSLVEG